MGRRAKPVKVKAGAKPPVARKARKREGSRLLDLEKRLAETSALLQEKDRALTEARAQVRETLEQQTATSDILRVISRSQTDLQPVFDTIIQSAVRVCGALSGGVFRLTDGLVTWEAYAGATTPEWGALKESVRAGRAGRPPRRESLPGWVMLEGEVVHVPDLAADDRFPISQEFARRGGYRSALGAPMFRDGAVIGMFVLNKTEPFTETQVALLQTFADQAVIAIENVRLFNELQTSNREIAEKSRQIAAASQHKSEFLANMSHELRTPLNAIIGYSELLEEEAGEMDGGRLVPDLQKIATAAKHQLSLINDILDLSKVEAGRMELELSDFDLPTTLDGALTLVRERAVRRGIAIQMEVDSRVGQVRADERKVRQAVLNLLSNAIKFTPEGGRIEVRAARKDGSVEVSVSDTGIGIAPEDQEKVFEEFRQVGAADRKVEGTGLGLALARKFIELHGGRIWVESEVGRGSTFTFSLPVGGGG